MPTNFILVILPFTVAGALLSVICIQALARARWTQRLPDDLFAVFAALVFLVVAIGLMMLGFTIAFHAYPPH